mgnify:FL=1
MMTSIKIKPIHFIAAILGLVILLMMECNRNSKLKQVNKGLEQQVTRVEANVEASLDTIEVYKTKNNYYVNQISGYQYTLKELESKNGDLLKEYSDALAEVSDLKKINQLLKAEVNIKEVDTMYASLDGDTSLVFEDSTNYGDNNWRKFEARVDVFLEDSIIKGGLGTFNYSQNIKLYAGIESLKGKKHINISTKYPGLTFNDIEGITLIEDELNTIKKQKRGRLCIGVGGGYGLTFTNSNLVYHGPQLGIYAIYSPKWLQF